MQPSNGFVVNTIFKINYPGSDSFVSNRKGGLNKRVGLAEFFVYYMKNRGEGGKFFCLLHEKQGEGVKISEIK